MITSPTDIKIYITNLLAIGISYTNAENALKIFLLIVSIAYTAERWIAAVLERKAKDKIQKNKNKKK